MIRVSRRGAASRPPTAQSGLGTLANVAVGFAFLFVLALAFAGY